MKAHTRQLTIFAGELATLGVSLIHLVVDSFYGLDEADFDELIVILRDKCPRLVIRRFKP